MMAFYRRFDLLFRQQLSYAQILIFQQAQATLTNTADLTILADLGTLVHSRPPC